MGALYRATRLLVLHVVEHDMETSESEIPMAADRTGNVYRHTQSGRQ